MIYAHDIVSFDKQVIEKKELPDWVVLLNPVFATVRRAATDHPETIPVGLRGTARNQRFALEIPAQMVQKVVHPWEITGLESFRQADIAHFPVYQQFHVAREILSGIKWGIGGSLGFELTTKIPAVKKTSDFDLLFYVDMPSGLPLEAIHAHPDFFEQVDTQVITKKMGFP